MCHQENGRTEEEGTPESCQSRLPMQMIAVDILPETPSGNSYTLVAGDYFTRCIVANPPGFARDLPVISCLLQI
jgi:hypothetical protein